MSRVSTTAPILVTGASGYIASWIVSYLLEAGHTVHATVRNVSSSKSTQHLLRIAQQHPNGTLKLFQADLLKPDAFDEAMKGCELVIHTASPFVVKGLKDAYETLIRPALDGTRNVLSSVNKTETVTRVVLTSSMAATFGDAVDLQKVPNKAATEALWNTSSTIDHQPYSFSKTLAEREAWKVNRQQERWDLICINPAMVLGPSLTKSSMSGSITMLKTFGDGSLRAGAPELCFGIVDVRDVARAHIVAGFSSVAHGRYLTSATTLTLLEIGLILRQKYKQYPLPTATIPKLLFWLVAPTVGYKRSFVSKNVGYHTQIDASKSQDELGLQYRPVNETLISHFQQLIDDGLIKHRR